MIVTHHKFSALLCAAALWIVAAPVALAQANGNGKSAAAASDPAVEARDALRRRDGPRLQALRDASLAQNHPLAQWIDYWEIGNRLDRAQQADLDAFYARWPGTYVEDRLRNDWLIELGKRRDWVNFSKEFPRFRMNDDREVTCYALLTDQLGAKQAGKALPAGYKARAFEAWAAQRDLDDGCDLMAATLFEAKVFNADDAWRRARLAAEANRPRQVRAAAGLAAPGLHAQVAVALDKPALYLNAGATVANRGHSEVATLALIRMAANEPEVAASQLTERWQQRLPRELAAWAWSQVGRAAAQKLMPEAADYFRNAWAESERAGKMPPAWSDDTLAWSVRSSLRVLNGTERWPSVQRAIDHMSDGEQRDTAWRYWSARAMRESAAPGAAGDRLRTQAVASLQRLASELHFYGKLAAEDLGLTFGVPARPQPLTDAERAAASNHPGLTRAMQLIGLGLRSEGVREWNFSLRGMNDRALLAAAQRACDREVWDRCINTSERTRTEIDLDQRFPMPFRDEVVAQATAIGLDPAYVYGLIRQESRFITDARSNVGASGLMQVMPATARWTARKIGLPFSTDQITDRNVNLKIGTSYLKFVLDDFAGSQALAAAAYNAGPSRPRRWREGATLEPAIWAENIPFTETRDYVKKVLSNATVYSVLLGGQRQPSPALPASAQAAASTASASASDSASAPPTAAQIEPPAPLLLLLPSLKTRLGTMIGPRAASAPPMDNELP